jgi:hypothetical protein
MKIIISCLLVTGIAQGAASAPQLLTQPETADKTTSVPKKPTRLSQLLCNLPSWETINNSQLTTSVVSFLAATVVGAYTNEHLPLKKPLNTSVTDKPYCPRAFNVALGTIPMVVLAHRLGKKPLLAPFIKCTVGTVLLFGAATKHING